jgi:hypothetical protein
VNVLLHTSQQYGRSPLCERLCLLRSLLMLNVFLHTSQQYGRSPLCKRLCDMRLLFRLNALQHTSQQYGRSAPCEHLCPTRSPSQFNALLHTLHEYRCSLVCAWSCSFPGPCQKHKGYTLGYFLTERTSILHAMFELTKKLLVLKSCIFEAKHCISTHHKTLNVSTDSSEWQYCCWGAWTFTKSWSSHKKICLRTMTYSKFQIGIAWSISGPGFVNPRTITATLPLLCIIFIFAQYWDTDLICVLETLHLLQCATETHYALPSQYYGSTQHCIVDNHDTKKIRKKYL